jgi:DNA-binding CsgD family transcriptional regulator
MNKNSHYFLKCFIIISLFTCFNNAFAQKTNKELIQLINQKNISADDKFKYLCNISQNYSEFDSIKAYAYAYKAIGFARELKSLNKEIIAYDYLALVAGKNDNVYKQIEIANQCFLLAKNSKNEEILAYCNFLTARKNHIIDDKGKYAFYMLKSLAYFEKEKKRYDKLVINYRSLATYFLLNNNIPSLKKYSEKALKLGNESNNDIHKAKGLGAWAAYLVYEAEQDPSKNKKLLDSAANCYLKSIKILESKKDYISISNRDYARGYINLASLYMYNLFDAKSAEKTIDYLEKAESICLEYNNNEALMAVYGIKAKYYLNIKNTTEAEKILKKLEVYANTTSEKKPENNYRVYNLFMNLAALKNDFSAYKKYFELYDKAAQDRNFKENNVTLYNSSVKFETIQKDKEIIALKELADARKKANYALIAMSILAFLTLFFMYKTYRFRQKTYAKANELLQKENDEAHLISKLNEEEAVNAMLELEIANRERKMAIQEKMLTEQQKEKLQHELMTNNLQLESKKTILKEIQNKLTSIKSVESKQISKTINKSIEVDEEFELLKSSFESANPVFFSTLQEKASQNLTKLDLKYCGYIKLGMSTKEIANIMNIEPKSMRMARYRIRQKLNLGKEDDLDDYVFSV